MSMSTKEITAAGAYVRQARAAAQTNASRGLFSSMLNRAADGMRSGMKASSAQDISLDADDFTNGGIAGLVANSDATKDLKADNTDTGAAASSNTGPVFSNGSSDPLTYNMIASSSGELLYNSPLPNREETRYPSAVRIRIKDGEVSVEDLGDARALSWSGAPEQHYPSRAQIVVTEDGSYNVTYYDDNGQEISGFDTITSQPKSDDSSTTKSKAARSSGTYATAAQILANGGVPIKDTQDTTDDTLTTKDDTTAAAQGDDTMTAQSSSALSALFGSDMNASDMQTLLMYALMGGMMGSNSGSGSTNSLFSDDSEQSGLMGTNPAAAALAAATGSLANAFRG